MARWFVIFALLIGFGGWQFAPSHFAGNSHSHIHTLDDSPQVPHK